MDKTSDNTIYEKTALLKVNKFIEGDIMELLAVISTYDQQKFS